MKKRNLTLVAAIAAAAMSTASFGAAIAINAYGTALTENFDTLSGTGSASITSLPTGWTFSEAGTAANTTYTAGTGSVATGDTYSFGAAASTDRALGTLLSGSLTSTIGASYTNSVSGGTLTALAISYRGEEWRLGAQNRADKLDFQYSLNAASVSDATATWVDVDALDFTTPDQVSTVGAINGNAAGENQSLSSTISGLSVASGATIWIRYTDLNATGADDGLAVDNFSLTASGTTPEPTTFAAILGIGALAARRQRLAR